MQRTSLTIWQRRVAESNKAKVLWNSTIQTDHVIKARRPHLVVLDRKMENTWVIAIAMPDDGAS